MIDVFLLGPVVKQGTGGDDARHGHADHDRHHPGDVNHLADGLHGALELHWPLPSSRSVPAAICHGGCRRSVTVRDEATGVPGEHG
jgi:hypothetical protein